MAKHASTHVLSLDAIDLNFLQSSSLAGLPTAPLWSTSSLGMRNAECLYEFVVKSASEASETAEASGSLCSLDLDKSTHELVYTTCYICNLKVPRPYLVEHINSGKHKAYMRIADTALVRIRKRMTVELEPEDQKTSSSYFCGACVAVVPISDRVEHEASATHKGSLSLDRLLNEFVALYADSGSPDEKEYDFSTELNSSNLSSAKVTTTSTTTTTDLKNEDEVTNASNDMKAFLDKTTRTKAKVNNEIIINTAKATDLSQYIAEIMKYDTVKHTFTVVDNEHLKISTPDGKELVVSVDHFHGFIKIGKKHMQCKVCKDIFKSVPTHICSEHHVQKVLLPLTDANCMRQLDESWSHCVLCNEVVENSDVHALCNSDHRKRLEEALVIDPEAAESEKKNKVYHCATCYMSMHVNSMESHMQGLRHAANLKAAEHYLMIDVDNKAEFVCTVCGIDVVKNCNSVREHNLTPDHIFKYNKLLAENKIINTKEDKFYCEPCAVNLIKGLEITHIERLNHKSKLAAFVGNKYSDKVRTTAEGKPPSDNKANPNASKSANPGELPNGCKDNSNNNTVQETKEIKPPVDDNTNYHFCLVCNVKVPNNPYNIKTHNYGNAHKKKLEKVLSQIEVISKNNSELMKQVATIKAEMDMHFHMEATDNPKELKCKACLVRIPNRPSNVDGHVNGVKHINNFMEIMKVNMIKIQNDQYTCTACKVQVKTGEEFLHIAHWKHKNMVMAANETGEAKETIAPHSLKATPVQNGSNGAKDKTQSNAIVANSINANGKSGDVEVTPAVKTEATGPAIAANDKTALKNSLPQNVNEKPATKDSRAQSGNETNVTKGQNAATGSVSQSANDKTAAKDSSLQSVDNETAAKDSLPQSANTKTAAKNLAVLSGSDDKTAKASIYDPNTGLSAQYHLMEEDNPKVLRCRVCHVNIPNTPYHIKTHTTGALHIAKYEAALSSHMIFLHLDSFVCAICGCYIPLGSELDHVTGRRHEKNSEHASFDTSEHYCTLCNVTTFGNSCIAEHVTGDQHRTNLTAKQSGQIHCHICDLTLTYNDNNIKVHNDGAQHKKNCELFEKHKIVIENGIYVCKACDSYIFGRASIDEHISGFNHMVRLEG